MTALLIINLVFLAVNIYWNNRLFERKNKLEERERKLYKIKMESALEDLWNMGDMGRSK
jgi:septation ring formation regulator EzrA